MKPISDPALESYKPSRPGKGHRRPTGRIAHVGRHIPRVDKARVAREEKWAKRTP